MPRIEQKLRKEELDTIGKRKGELYDSLRNVYLPPYNNPGLTWKFLISVDLYEIHTFRKSEII